MKNRPVYKGPIQLLRYFERSTFLLFYDSLSTDRWILLVPILGVALLLLFFSFFQMQRLLSKTVNYKLLAALSFLIPLVAFLSFIRKSHTQELNCWYHIDNRDSSFKITFAATPEHLFDATSTDKKLKQFVRDYGIKDEFRPGAYCPETEVKVVTRFKKVTSVYVVGFRNSETDTYYKFPTPVELDYNELKGDKGILEPDFEL